MAHLPFTRTPQVLARQPGNGRQPWRCWRGRKAKWHLGQIQAGHLFRWGKDSSLGEPETAPLRLEPQVKVLPSLPGSFLAPGMTLFCIQHAESVEK